MKKKIIIYCLLFLSIDIISKMVIDYNFKANEIVNIIPNFFSLTKVYNEGASWSILSGERIFLIIITVIILGMLLYYVRKFKMNKRNILAFSMLFGGILGNLLNRIIYGYVIDFLDFKIFDYDYPVFNFADIWIVFGIILLVIAILKKEDNNENSSR